MPYPYRPLASVWYAIKRLAELKTASFKYCELGYRAWNGLLKHLCFATRFWSKQPLPPTKISQFNHKALYLLQLCRKLRKALDRIALHQTIQWLLGNPYVLQAIIARTWNRSRTAMRASPSKAKSRTKLSRRTTETVWEKNFTKTLLTKTLLEQCMRAYPWVIMAEKNLIRPKRMANPETYQKLWSSLQHISQATYPLQDSPTTYTTLMQNPLWNKSPHIMSNTNAIEAIVPDRQRHTNLQATRGV